MLTRTFLIPLVTATLFACGGDPPRPITAGSGEATTEEGKALIEQGDYEAAAKVLKSVVEREPADAEARFYLGVSLENTGGPAEAKEQYNEALRLKPDLLEAHNNLGLILMDEGDLKGAEASLAKYLEAADEEADAHYNYGLVLVALDQNAKAKEHFSRAVELAPEDPMPILSLGDLERAAGNNDAALGEYRRAMEVAPGEPACLFSVFQAQVDLGQTEAAAETMKGLGGLEKADATQLTTGGMLLAKIDLDDEAMDLYRKAIEKDDGFARAHVLLANALARSGKFAAAAEHFERFLELAPNAKEAEAARKGLAVCKAKAGS